MRYFRHAMQDNGVTLKPGQSLTAREIKATECDAVIVATGVSPRKPEIDGINHSKVVSYIDVISGKTVPGKRVAIIGAGGIGFDVATLLVQQGGLQGKEQWLQSWGIDMALRSRGGLLMQADNRQSAREIYMLQRKQSRIGASLGKTTGWIHRTTLRNSGVEMLNGVKYQKIDDSGLHITQQGNSRILEVDHIIICAGQNPNRLLADELKSSGILLHVIGGADKARELDAERAIRQGMELAAKI
jgi:2,4-dienoyl-CoA reductase (NADPH2)